MSKRQALSPDAPEVAEDTAAWLWQSFFSDSLDPCFVLRVGPGLRLVLAMVNRAYERQTGLVAEHVLGRDPTDALAPAMAEVARARLAAVMASGQPATFVEPLGFPSGERVWRTHLVPVRDPQGTVTALAGMAHDMTETVLRERAQAAQAEADARYRLLAENVPDVIYRMTLVPAMKFDYVSPATVTQTGYTPEEYLADPGLFMRIMHPEDRASVRQRLMGGKYDGPAMVVRVHAKDGTLRWLEPHSVPVCDAEGRLVGIEGVLRDVTARRRAEAEREAFERRLQETQKLESLGVLAGGIAHDFNNILTGILGGANLLRRSLPSSGAPLVEVEQIEKAALRAAELCRQMLAYAGKARFVVEAIDLGALVRDTMALLASSISKRAQLAIHLPSDLPPIEADATQLRQVVMNLLVNASEAIEGDGVITVAASAREVDRSFLQGTVGAADLPAGQYVLLEVTDTGCGMAPEAVARVFEPFYTTKFAGRGLGLSAVLGILRGHRGAIRVRSEERRGSTFTLVLPAAPAAGARPNAAPPARTSWTGSGAVLLVEDEAAVRRWCGLVLRDCGFEVIEARDGADGVARFHEHAGRLVAVLMDLTMPVMDGATAFEEIRRSRPDVPVLLMSGYSEQDALAKFASKGLAGFVQKPFGVETLVAAMRAAVGG